MKKLTFKQKLIILSAPLWITLGCASLSYNLASQKEGQYSEFLVTNTTKKPINWFELKVLYEDIHGETQAYNIQEGPKSIHIVGYIIERRLDPGDKIRVLITKDDNAQPNNDSLIVIVESSRIEKLFPATSKMDLFGEDAPPKWLDDVAYEVKHIK